LKQLFLRLAYAGCLDSDTESERLSKAILVATSMAISFLAIFWTSGYLLLGRPISAAIPGIYAVFSLLSGFVFFKTKHYGLYRSSQLLFILMLPFPLQWTLGGFSNGSAVMIWAIFSPLGALMFHGVRQAIPWFIAYLFLTVLSGVFDSQLAAAVPPMPEVVITVFFVMNLGFATLLMYVVVNYFVVDNQRIIAAVSHEKEKAEKALAETERAKAIIEEQASKLIEMDQIKSRFFANISHEFRTPLTLIIGPLEDCLAGLAKPAQSQLEVMLRNCRRLLRLINQLLDIAKLEAGGMKLSTKKGNLTQLIKGIVSSFAPSAERNGISLQVNADIDDVEFNFDAEKLEKIFSNLLSNALKFTARGGKVYVSCAYDDSQGDQSVRITVKDTGHGIPKEELPFVFDRFRQVDETSTRSHEGTGIGLALVKDLVTLHGGRIDVSSEPGFGAEFIVTLPCELEPLTEAEPETAEEDDLAEYATLTDTLKSEIAGLEQHFVSQGNGASHAHALATALQVNKNTVLVIDDNPDIRAYLAGCLESIYNVLQAKDGVDGLRIAQEVVPDLVICDIMMPGMDGYEVCQSLKSDSHLNHIPFIFLTAKASSCMKVEGLQVGADDYISKPFNAKELVTRAGNLIMLRQQQRELKVLNEHLEEKVKQQLETILKSKRLNRYFSKKLLNQIVSSDKELTISGERRKITVLFSDLHNFTDLADSIESENICRLLNEYLSEMTALIELQDATLVQVIGDGMMVFFGAPDYMESQQQAMKAVKLAVLMQQKTQQLSKKWMSEGLEQDIKARIGIHQDYLTVGNFGGEAFMEFTAVGKGINLASRLEASCTPGSVKISHSIYTLTCDEFSYGPVHDEQFKGFARQVNVCELDPKILET